MSNQKIASIGILLFGASLVLIMILLTQYGLGGIVTFFTAVLGIGLMSIGVTELVIPHSKNPGVKVAMIIVMFIFFFFLLSGWLVVSHK